MNIVDFRYNTFGKFIVRLPQYPVEKLFGLLHNSNLIESEMRDPFIREAIYLASPLLEREIQKLISGQIESEKKANRIKNSFLKYYTRFCSRCTPYGTFATCSCAKIENETIWEIDREIQRHIRFDTYFLSEFVRYISSNEEIRSYVKYYTNTSIYSVGRKYRYIEYEYDRNRHLHKISSVEKNKYLNAILRKGKNGIKFYDIVKTLTMFGIEENEAIEYADELIRNQLLIGEFELKLNEKDILNQLASFFKENSFCQEDSLLTKEFILTSMQAFESVNKMITPGNAIEIYKGIIEKANNFSFSVEENTILQVDSELRHHERISIGKDVIKELNDVIIFFLKTCSQQPGGLLKQFSDAFYERFEEQEVPLLVALDPEIGISYPPNNGQSDSFTLIPKIGKSHRYISNRNVTIDVLLLRKLLEMREQNTKELVFREEDLGDINITQKVPNSLYCFFRIIRRQGSYCLLEPIIGVSPTSLIGRFAYMNQDIEDFVRTISKKEQQYINDAVYAEIRHIPSSRIGNINNITHVWDYEILLLTGSEISEKAQIPISDLMLSYRNGELFLRSKKLNKRIIPIVSNAHKYDFDTQPIYKFLCDLQYQNRKSFYNFSWDNLRQILNHFPRVRYKNTILSLELWILNKNEIEEICKSIDSMDEFRCKRKIPRYVYLADGDNTLFVDFESQKSMKAFISTIKNKNEIVLKETMIEECNKNDFPYVNECIVPLYK